ncbi:sulfatase [Carboxylicivirga mesophila]|uniref:Sulfatase n=1 Tax=Carboxylicivirga mesophila TaxID=1166478 RepID=A0ABS5K8G4_9BACT|nr:sulfatase [Carboxylicivirga mesophila]MBS2211280.1 sulfatase [Carboxylicivirga mesophila]
MRYQIPLLFLLLCFFSKSYSQTDKPNVILIMCDDLNDYQGVFGGHPQAQTPNIDAMAATGVQFINAQSNVPVCQPSRNSLFTGVYPHESNDFGWTGRTKQPVLKHNKTLMQLFQENGYYTLGTGKLLHGNNEPKSWDEWGMNTKHNYGPFPFDGEKMVAHPKVPQPYQSIGPVDGSYGRLSTCDSWVYGRDKKPFNYESDDKRDLMQDELHAQWASNKLKELEAKDSSQPFFMGVGFVNPHTPIHAPDRFFDMFPIEELELAPWLENDAEDTFLKDNINPNNKGFRYYRSMLESYNGDRELALKHFLQAYLACVAFVDEQIGKVLDTLEKTKFKDNTIVILTADHGWQMGEKNYLFKNSPWDESARVPMVIMAPDAHVGAKVEQPVSLVDIYPTLLDYCNLSGSNTINEEGGKLGGYSMVPLLDNDEETIWRGPRGALTIVGNIGSSTAIEEQHYSYRTKDWRYIRYADGTEELYHHKNDPHEWKNLVDDNKYKMVKLSLYKEVCEILGVKL